ncbi:MAG: ThuA domain-containing protein [Candidatus Latescibacteria bacterium]|nr:ThuA domain-containing protein [Candidatus Latescibacterota bacterium]
MKKILLLINATGGVFADFAAMFTRIAGASGQFQLEVSTDRARLENLSGFDAVALYIGGGELTPAQEKGITGFVRQGGGLLGVHGANAGLAQYKEYTEMIGSEFIGHDPLAPFDVETVAGIDDALPRLSKSFRISDECYNMKIHTEAPLRYFQHGHWRLDRKPLGYLRDYGQGKVCYTALGHDKRAFGHPDFQDQLIKGLRYVCGMKDKGTIRIGLVGYGPLFNMGKHHSEQIAKTHGFTLAAVCDQDPRRLEAAKQEQGEQIATFTDSGELIKSGLIDLAIVIVPHVYHAPVARPFLEAGIHVITEKPFTVHVSEAEELIALAKQKGVMISVYHNRHWDPDIVSLRQIIETGVIGELYSIECNMTGYGYPGQAWRSQKEISGGMLYDMGAHQFEKILQLVPQQDGQGKRINKKATLYGNFLKRVWHSVSNEDFCRAYVRFDSGLEAQLLQSNIHASPRPLWTVQGTKGSVVMDGWDGSATVSVPGEDGRITTSQAPSQQVPSVQNKDRWGGYYKNAADHLLAGLPLIITGEWAKGPIQCIEGCETAARENRLVEIELGY